MKYRLEIAADNAAFGGTSLSRGLEIGRILVNAGKFLEEYGATDGLVLYDRNGNRVGQLELVSEE